MFVGFVLFNADPRVNAWPLMDSPFPTLIMVITYLYIVTYLGPKVMANRKPFKLNNVLVLYNAGQVVFSFVMLWEVGRFSFVVGADLKKNQSSSVLYRCETETRFDGAGRATGTRARAAAGPRIFLPRRVHSRVM